MTTSGHEEPRDLLRRAYAAYNAQDADTLVELVGDDVDWPDGGDGRLHGRAEVHAYWTEQWTRVRAHDEPLGFAGDDDGRSAVRIHQVVRSLDGTLISERDLVHLFRVDGGLIRRMDIERA